VTSEISGIRQSAPGIYQGGMFQGRSGISSSGDVPDWQEVGGGSVMVGQAQDDGFVAKG